MRWVLVQGDGSFPFELDLPRLAKALEIQLNADYAPECGLPSTQVVAGSESDVREGDAVCLFVPDLPDAPDAVAYHALQGGLPDAFVAVNRCSDMWGIHGVSVATSHELLEAAGDPGANRFALRDDGVEVAWERCDAVECQTYAFGVDGVQVRVSNFLLDSWGMVDGKAPFTFMTKHGIGGVDPPGPMQVAPSDDGQSNYSIVLGPVDGEKQIYADNYNIVLGPVDGEKQIYANNYSIVLGPVDGEKQIYAEGPGAAKANFAHWAKRPAKRAANRRT